MTSEELEKSLRTEVDNYVNSRVTGLHDEIERLQSQTNEAFTRLLERSTGESLANTSLDAVILEHLRAAHERGVGQAAEESSRTKASSDVAILKSSIDEIDEQRSQADILTSLVNRAASFAPRIAFFVVKTEQFIGWRARGMQGTIGDDAIREISVAVSDDTVLGDAIRSRATWSGAPGSHSNDDALLDNFSDAPPQRMVAIPLIARDKAAAVLYADSDALGPDAINLEALETLVRVAGMAVELLAVERAAPTERRSAPVEPRVWPEAPAAQPSEPEPETEAAPPSEEASWPLAEAPAAAEAEAAQPEPEPMVVPPVEGQPLTSASGQLLNPLGTARRYAGGDVDLPIDVSDDEKANHVGARRFARLLVSEIKLYNEQRVREGREEGDLYGRLRDAIDRSREMYDKRYAASVGSQYDYFHHEIVNTLAEGDSEKLGASYPGASVLA